MAKRSSPRPLKDRVSERVHGNTSEAYLWIRVAYRRLRPRMAVRYPPYDKLAAEMVEAGVPGGGGTVLTTKAVRRLWLKVCEDQEAEAQARTPRERPPAYWKPQPVRTPAPAPVPVPRPTVQPNGRTATGVLAKPPQLSPEEVEAKIEAMRERLRDRNR